MIELKVDKAFQERLEEKFPFLETDFYTNNDLNKLDKQVYLMLSDLTKKGPCWMKVDDIAELLEKKPRKVAFSLHRLSHTTISGMWKNSIAEVIEIPLTNMFFLRYEGSKYIDKVHFCL